MDRRITINAVAFPEGETWVVQGIEYDIVAEAGSPSQIAAAFVKAVVENLCISEELGKEPLAGIGRAPAHFKELFDEAYAEMIRAKVPTLPTAEMAIRLAEHA